MFPPDPLSMLADRIIGSKVAPSVSAARVARDFISDSQGLPGRTVENVLEMISVETGLILSDTAMPIKIDDIGLEIDSL